MYVTKILVVDDDLSVRTLVKSILSGKGYELIEVADGGSACEVAISERPDLILLDVLMPGMGGFDVLGKLKDDPDTKLIPVIMLTAKGLPRDEARGMRLGAADYITKPCSREEIEGRVRLALS